MLPGGVGRVWIHHRSARIDLRMAWTLSALEDLGSRLSAIESLADDAHKAKALVLLCWYPGHPDEDRRGVHHRDLFQKIPDGAPLGYGCCSDQSEVFIALASMIGLPAREVQNPSAPRTSSITGPRPLASSSTPGTPRWRKR